MRKVDKAWRNAIAIAAGELSFVENFYKDEWVKVVQAQEVYNKVAYCKASRIGRGVRLDRKVRMQIWDVFDEYQNIMNEKLQRDVETAMYECRKILENKKLTGQYTSIIVDEGQDLNPSAYRLLDRQKMRESGYTDNIIDSYEKLFDFRDYGITCLSANDIDYLPMWAYYTNNHKGFCIEYEVIKKDCIHEVLYEPERIKVRG